jgi:hypothetical protein
VSAPPSEQRWPALLVVGGPAAASAAVFLACYRWSPLWLFPALLAVPLFPVFAACVRQGRDGRACAGVLAWSTALALCATGVSMRQPMQAERVIWNGRAYAEQTIAWVRTGEGIEQQPRRFLPRHAAELVAFSLLALATGGAGGLVLGAALLNYMSFYVAALWRLSSGAPLALVLGWPPYALIRVVAYSLLGTALARPLLSRGLPPRTPRPVFSRRLLFLGLGGVALDALLKSFLAPGWRQVLLQALGGPP